MQTKERTFHFLIALALLFCLASAPLHAQDQPAKDNNTKSIPLDVTLIPKLEADRAFARININGEPLKVALDTGASLDIVLFSPAAKKLNLELTPIENLPGYSTTTARVGTDTKGTLSDPISLRVIDAPAHTDVAGLIGWPFLQQHILDIHFPKRLQASYDTLPEEAKDWPSYEIKTSKHGIMTFLVTIDGEEQPVYFDLGSQGAVALGPEQWKTWLDKEKPEWITIEGGYSPGNKDGFFTQELAVTNHFKLGDLDLGKVAVEQTFANATADKTEVEVPYLIGSMALQRRRVIIDGPGKRIYFGPLTEPADPFVQINRAQATYLPKHLKDTKTTAHVIEGGVAHQAGLRDGDHVIMLNGMLTSDWMTNHDVLPSRALTQKPGTPIRLFIERDGEQFPITFELGESPFDTEKEKEEQKNE